MVVVSVLLGSGVPLFTPAFATAATLSTEAGAAGGTATTSVSVGRSASWAMLSLLVQVTSCPAALQLRPVPVPETYESPAGSVSVTVVGAGSAEPLLCTTRE